VKIKKRELQHVVGNPFPGLGRTHSLTVLKRFPTDYDIGRIEIKLKVISEK
jgi:hypothetical protein